MPTTSSLTDVLEAGSDKSNEPIDNKTSLLKNIFGYESFKGKQEEAVNAILDGDNYLIVLPTGGGKSLCYAIPTVISGCVSIIICPLLDGPSKLFKIKGT